MYRLFETKFGGLSRLSRSNNAIIAHLIACIMDGAESYSDKVVADQDLIESSFNGIRACVQFNSSF